MEKDSYQRIFKRILQPNLGSFRTWIGYSAKEILYKFIHTITADF